MVAFKIYHTVVIISLCILSVSILSFLLFYSEGLRFGRHRFHSIVWVLRNPCDSLWWGTTQIDGFKWKLIADGEFSWTLYLQLSGIHAAPIIFLLRCFLFLRLWKKGNTFRHFIYHIVVEEWSQRFYFRCIFFVSLSVCLTWIVPHSLISLLSQVLISVCAAALRLPSRIPPNFSELLVKRGRAG